MSHPAYYSPLTLSILLDGVDGFPGERVDFGNFAAVNPERTDAFTAAIWFKVVGGGNDRIFGKAAGSTGWRIQHGAAGPGRILWSLRSGTESLQIETITAGGAPAIDDGAWHLVVGVADGAATLTSSDIHIFIDGVEMTGGQVGFSGADITTTTQTAIEMLVGETGSNNAGNFNGNVCHAACWNFAMSAAEVLELWAGGRPVILLTSLGKTASFADPVFWAPLGDGDALGAGNIIDLVSANNGEYFLGEVGDFEADVPALTLTTLHPLDVSDIPNVGDDQISLDNGSFPVGWANNPPVTQLPLPITYVEDNFSIPSTNTFFKMRGRDQTCPAGQQPAYVYWVVQDVPDETAAFAMVSDLICGSDPLTDIVDITVAMKWKE